MHWNFAIFWINSQPNWTIVWASKTFVWNKAPKRVIVGNWADQRFVQNMSKIPPHRVQLLIYFLSYTRNLQLANYKLKLFNFYKKRPLITSGYFSEKRGLKIYMKNYVLSISKSSTHSIYKVWTILKNL